MSRGKGDEDEDVDTALQRCRGVWTWRDDRSRLEFCPETGPPMSMAKKRHMRVSARSDVSVSSEDSIASLAPWPPSRTRMTWPSLALVWDTFGTQPETPSRREVSPIVKASRNWLRACNAPLPQDMQTRPGRMALHGVVGMRKSYINMPMFSRQASSINSRQLSQASRVGMGTDSALASSVTEQTSPALVAAKLTYARTGPVTLEIVKEVAALELDLDTECPSRDFFDLLQLPSFNDFLMAALRCTHFFQQLKAVEKQLEEMASDIPGSARQHAMKKEKRARQADVDRARHWLSVQYGGMLLPLNDDYRRFHHSGAGSWRTSRTNADQMLQEAVFRFTCAVVWIALGREQWLAIATELGRLFRSEEFNISGRLAGKPSERALESKRLQRRRLAASGGPISSHMQRNTASEHTIPIAIAAKMTSPLVSCLLSSRKHGMAMSELGTPPGEDLQIGILGKPVLDFTPFLEPKPELRRAPPSESGSETSTDGGSTESESSLCSYDHSAMSSTSNIHHHSAASVGDEHVSSASGDRPI